MGEVSNHAGGTEKGFERIGIGAKDDFEQTYEEWFITDYDCYVDGLYDLLEEYANLDELNHLTSKLDYMNQDEYERFQATGYGFHHETEDGKYLIMANGSRAFAIPNGDTSEHTVPEKLTVLVVEPMKEPYVKENTPTSMRYKRRWAAILPLPIPLTIRWGWS